MTQFCKVVLTFKSADKILLCDHSNKISLVVLSCGATGIWFFNILQNESLDSCPLMLLVTFHSNKAKASFHIYGLNAGVIT